MTALKPLLALLCLAVATQVASAEPVTYDVEGRLRAGFLFWTHTTHRLDGEILAERDLDAMRVDFTGGLIEADSLGRTGLLFGSFDKSEDIEIEVTGGWLRAYRSSGRAAGYLETIFRQDGADDTTVHMYFTPFWFGRPADRFLDPDLLSFAVWSDISVFSHGSHFHPSLRGADIRASGLSNVSHNPEPGTMVLVGALVAGAAAVRRRRTKGKRS